MGFKRFLEERALIKLCCQMTLIGYNVSNFVAI